MLWSHYCTCIAQTTHCSFAGMASLPFSCFLTADAGLCKKTFAQIGSKLSVPGAYRERTGRPSAAAEWQRTGAYRDVPDAYRGVPDAYRGVPDAYRGVPGRTGAYRGVPGRTGPERTGSVPGAYRERSSRRRDEEPKLRKTAIVDVLC